MPVTKNNCEKVFRALEDADYVVTPKIKRVISTALRTQKYGPKKERKLTEYNLFIKKYKKKNPGKKGRELINDGAAAWRAYKRQSLPLQWNRNSKSASAKKPAAKKPAAKKSAKKSLSAKRAALFPLPLTPPAKRARKQTDFLVAN